eukprot:4774706-Alexandrium_andersonii.AAC.1
MSASLVGSEMCIRDSCKTGFETCARSGQARVYVDGVHTLHAPAAPRYDATASPREGMRTHRRGHDIP